MRHLAPLIATALLATATAGCFDSIISGKCAAGFDYSGGQCVAAGDIPDAPPDGGVPDPDGGPDAVTCDPPLVACSGVCIDVTSDPDNCGACGRVCASGICQASVCVGALAGHVVAIGHDYENHNPAMRRLLANAASLGAAKDLAIARLRGSATAAAHTGTGSALANGMQQVGRTWHAVQLPATPSAEALVDVDVVVVEAQVGDGEAARSLGQAWSAPFDGFVRNGGVVIVLEGGSGVSYRFSAAAGLYVADPPLDATGLRATIVDASDAVTQQVVSPYLAEGSSAALPNLSGPIVTAAGTLVIHQTTP